MTSMDKETFRKLSAFIKGDNLDGALNIIEKLEKNLDYCLEENDILREVIRDGFGCKRIKLKENQKCRLGVKLLNIEAPLREDYARIFQPETIIRWYRNFAGQKYNSAANRKKGGRPPVPQNIIDEVLRLARQNSNWGYDRIAGVMAYLGLKVGRSTVKRILDDHGITPEPLHKPNMSWREFIDSHKSVIAATDFLETELNTEHGPVRCKVLFFIEYATRKVHIAGISTNPDGAWMKQVARNLLDYEDGFLLGKKYLIHDRDTLYTKDFLKILKGAGVESKRLPAYCPDMNSVAERFIKSLKSECLDWLIFSTVGELRYAIKEYVEWYHHERPHKYLGGRMIEPWSQSEDGEIVEFSRLGGLLKSYRRVPLKVAA